MRVLLVGVGGVGSEILKNLLTVGFRRIDVIDLDTIELSNLNRQFLFRNAHVGMAKADVAKLSAESMVEGKQFSGAFSMAVYILDVTTLDYKFFSQYRLVLNALDANEPRFHVNRMCVLANIPLVESGTSGHLGQTSAIVPGITECYACTEKPKKQITYPVCTIRSTPSKMIHCVVWAKALFNQLFNENASSFDDDVGPEDEREENGGIVRITTHEFAINCGHDPEKIFKKLYHDDIEILLTMEKLWEKRTPPSIWSSAYDHNLRDSFNRNLLLLYKRYSEYGTLVFDKDDDTMIEFIHAASNIRALLFGISQESLFDIRHMAGAIIPAVATTNAIAAGLAVLQGLSILNKSESTKTDLKHVFISYKLLDRSSQTMRYTRKPVRRLFIGHSLISSFEAPSPSTNCFVCGQGRLRIKLNIETATVGDLRYIFQKKMFLENVEATTVNGMVFISPEFTDDRDIKTLKSLQLKDGCTIFVDGFLSNAEMDQEKEAKCYEIILDHDDALETAETES